MEKYKKEGLAVDFEISVIKDFNETLDFINGLPSNEKEECLSFIRKAKQDSSYSLSIDQIRQKNGSLYVTALCFDMFADASSDLVLLKARAEDSEKGLTSMLEFAAGLYNLASGRGGKSEL